MTFTIEFTPEEAESVARLEAQGVDVSACLRETIARLDSETPKKVLRASGKYAYLPRILENFEREKQAEIEREDRQLGEAKQ